MTTAPPVVAVAPSGSDAHLEIGCAARGPAGSSCLFVPRAVAVLAVIISLSGFRFQQQDPDSALHAVIAAALEAPELPAMAAGLIDTIGGRLSGTPSGTRAEAWAAGWLRSFGLDTVYYQVLRIPVWRRGNTYVHVVTPAIARLRPIAAITFGYSPGITSDSVPVVDVGRGDSASVAALGARARGAAWLTDAISPELIRQAVDAGAAALLRVTFQAGRLPQARVAPWPEPPAPLPLLALSREDGLWLRRQLVGGGPVILELRVEAETRAGTVLNVIGELKGSDPSVAHEIFIIGAHLDSWDIGDGAIDNGTGVLSTMAAVNFLHRAYASAPS